MQRLRVLFRMWNIWKIGVTIFFKRNMAEKDVCHAHMFCSLDCNFPVCIRCEINMINSYEKILLLGKLVLKLLISKYDEVFSRSSPFIVSFIIFKSICSLLLLFLAMVTKFFYLELLYGNHCQ